MKMFRAVLAGLVIVGDLAYVAVSLWPMNVWASDGRFVNYLLAIDRFVRAEKMPPNDALWQPVDRAVSSAAARFGGLWGQCR